MTGIEVVRKVASRWEACLFRPRRGDARVYDVKPLFTGKKRGWVLLDAYSASAVMAVHGRLRPENQKRYEELPLSAMVLVAFKLLKKKGDGE